MMKQYLLSALLVPFSLLIFAQPIVTDLDRFAFEPELAVDARIPTPKDYLGYDLGDAFTLYAHVAAYHKTLADASPRVIYGEYGKTYEGRPLIYMIISSEENIKNIESIREEHLSLLDNPTNAAAIIEKAPVFTSFSYNIHGNEASSSEAAMQVAYRMAAATDQETLDVLDKSVIIMYICINPDGRDRYAYWYKSMKRIGRPGFEPQDMEHFEGWPGGRTNHYWFDLNRDWIWGVHPESRGHTTTYQKWMPQVHVDYHEQGYNNNYFTMPGTTPRNKLLPDAYEPWSKVFGDANVAEFDKHQINYFTRDRFDFFYPGYGSSYPSVMGAIGMLTEQGGHAAGGRIVETNDGYHLTLRQRIFDHYTTSIATIKTSAQNRKELLQYSLDAWKPANQKSATKVYFFSDQDLNSSDLVNVLLRNNVEIYQADKSFQSTAKNYRTGRTAKITLSKGSYIVPADQPRALFVSSIMERNMSIEDSVMYDMATWSGPIAYNLEAYSSNAAVSVAMTKITEPIIPVGTVVNGAAQYAYVIDWTQRTAPNALAKLWAKGYRVRSAFEPFGSGSETFSAGSLIVLKGRNLEKAESIDQDMATIASESGVRVVGFESGRMAWGMDLASGRNVPIKQPKIGMMMEQPFSSYTGGQIYFLFDWETQLPIDRIRTTTLQQTSLPKQGFRFGGVDLNDYDVWILPGGGSALSSIFTEKEIADIKEWVSKGGVLVATESAANFFADKSKLTDVAFKETPKDSSDQIKYLPYAAQEDYNGKKRIPGAAMSAKIDVTHPLAFGMKEELYALKFGVNAIVPSAGLETVGYYHRDPSQLLVAGYASSENLSHLAGGTFAGVKNIGQGKVVYLVDNTQYRMFWLGPTRLMLNAVMQLPGY
jgi:hypothetical protein